MKKYFAILILIIFFAPIKIFALGIILGSPKNTFSPGEEFYVDVFIDPTGVAFNGIEGVLSVEDGLNIVRIEDGNSIVKNWVSMPETKNETSFSGIIPNGFDGYVNTPNDNKGLIFRVVLSAKNAGNYNFLIKDLKVARNDGLGTIVNVGNKSIKIGIVGSRSDEKYVSDDKLGPEISYEIVSDKNLFSGRYTLVFSATDNKSGIKSFWVKEGSLEWKPAQSPYLLEDQSRKGIIIIRAVDNNGNETIEKIYPVISAYFTTVLAKLILAVAMLGLIVAVYYARKRNKKQKKLL